MLQNDIYSPCTMNKWPMTGQRASADRYNGLDEGYFANAARNIATFAGVQVAAAASRARRIYATPQLHFCSLRRARAPSGKLRRYDCSPACCCPRQAFHGNMARGQKIDCAYYWMPRVNTIESRATKPGKLDDNHRHYARQPRHITHADTSMPITISLLECR